MFHLRDESGSILLMTVVIFSILSVLALSLLPLSIIELKSSQSFLNYQKSYFLAESGLEKATANLSASTGWENGSFTEIISDGSCNVTILGDDITKLIRSTGKIDDVSRTLEMTVTKDIEQNSLSVISWHEVN